MKYFIELETQIYCILENSQSTSYPLMKCPTPKLCIKTKDLFDFGSFKLCAVKIKPSVQRILGIFIIQR